MNHSTKNMTVGKPLPLIFSFALPLMIGNVFQQFYVIVDTIVVGQMKGVAGLAAIGAADWTNWMVLGIATGFTQGFAIPVAQQFGAENYPKMRKTIAAYIVMAIGIACTVLLFSELFASPILQLLRTPEDVMDQALLYLRICFAGVPVIVAYNTMGSILRALGNGRDPLIAMFIAALINILLDLLFVMYFDWGVAGAAIATVIAQAFSCLYCLYILRRIPLLKMKRSDWNITPSLCFQLFRLGFPIALQNITIAIGGMVVQFVVNAYGYLFIAGFTATNKLYGVLEVAATSYGFSMTTYTGQNLGAKKYQRIQQGTRAGALTAIVTALFISVCMILFGKSILSLFISGTPEETQAALKIAWEYLLVLSIPLVILYLLHIYRSALMGLGDAITPMISGFIEFLMRVASVLLLPAIIGVKGIYLAEILAWAGATAILMIVYYRRMRKFKQDPHSFSSLA